MLQLQTFFHVPTICIIDPSITIIFFCQALNLSVYHFFFYGAMWLDYTDERRIQNLEDGTIIEAVVGGWRWRESRFRVRWVGWRRSDNIYPQSPSFSPVNLTICQFIIFFSLLWCHQITHTNTEYKTLKTEPSQRQRWVVEGSKKSDLGFDGLDEER